MTLLKKIRLIEIEISSYCNRKCKWCPNSFIDRSFMKEMPEKVFLKLLNELAIYHYSKYISFSRYNEPFANKELLEKRISQVRKILPNVKIVCNTNGDFNYKGTDIDELTVMDYDYIKEEKLSYHVLSDKIQKRRLMTLVNINNRAGALKLQQNFIRTYPCLEPTYFVGIDYTGDVVPCCNIRHDIKEHEQYVLGNIKNKSLETILSSQKAIIFREQVKNMNFFEICLHCSKKEGRYTRDKPGIEG